MTTVRELMTPDPIILESTEPVTKAAQCMAENKVGNVLVEANGELCGIVTDRDIVVRGIAMGMSPEQITIGELCEGDLVTVGPDDRAGDAIRMMRDRQIRRLPVVENGQAVGVISLGDLAEQLDEKSLLGQISAAPANN